MRIRTAPVLAAALGLAIVSTTGCRVMTDFWGWCCLSGDLITYDQYRAIDQSLKPAPSVDDVINQLGTPMAVHDKNGARRRIDYNAYGLDDTLKRAEFTFDENERLQNKVLW